MAVARLSVGEASNTRRAVLVQLIRDREHVEQVVDRGVRRAKVSVWIASANLKDLHVEAQVGTRSRAAGRYVSLFDELQQATRGGVDVRILHAGPASRALALRLKQKRKTGAQLRRCPRVHLKMIAIDGTLLYLGSANFTGAGLGAKGDAKRNFEAGIVTDDDWLLDEMQGTFDAIWTGRRCRGCQLRDACPKPLDTLAVESDQVKPCAPRLRRP